MFIMLNYNVHVTCLVLEISDTFLLIFCDLCARGSGYTVQVCRAIKEFHFSLVISKLVYGGLDRITLKFAGSFAEV